MLNEEQKKNFSVFMSRVNLEGKEVAAFNDLVATLLAEPVAVPVVEKTNAKKN